MFGEKTPDQSDVSGVPDAQTPRRPSVLAASTLFLIYFAGSMLLLLAYPYFAGVLPENEVARTVFLTMASELLFVLLPGLLLLRLRPKTIEGMRFAPLAPGQARWIVLAALATLFFNGSLSTLWTGLLMSLGLGPGLFSDPTPFPQTAQQWWMLFLMTAVIAPLCEEFFARGILLPAWESYGPRNAIVISALMFMCMHGSIAGMPLQFFAGLVMGYLVVRTGSLRAGVLFHFVNNALNMLMLAFVMGAGVPIPDEKTLYEAARLNMAGGGLIWDVLKLALYGWILVYSVRKLWPDAPMSLPERRQGGTRLKIGSGLVLGLATAFALFLYWAGLMIIWEFL